MEKVNFAHVCFAAATMTGLASIASLLGHADGYAVLHVCGTAVGIVGLSIIYANFIK